MSRRLALPADAAPEQFTIGADPREQRNWNFAPQYFGAQVELTLCTGDYTVIGCENDVRVERKELGDLVGCATHDRDRFERELRRLLAFPARIVIVEAGWQDVLQARWRSKLTAKAMVASIIGWQAMGVPFAFPGDRGSAENYAAQFLFIVARRRYRELRGLVGNDEPAKRSSPSAYKPETIASFDPTAGVQNG